MELDDLKNIANKNIAQLPPLNTNIMDMINADSKSPLAVFERKLKLTMYIFPFVVILFGGRFITQGFTKSPTALLLFAILALEFFVALINYFVVRKIRQSAGPVKENLLGKIDLLQNRYRWYLLIHSIMYLLMAVLLEITMYKHWDANFEGWYSVNVFLRVAVYIAFMIVQYMLKYSSQKKHYGQYLDQLHTLASQME